MERSSWSYGCQEERPDQQRAVQDAGAVLEVDTHVEIQQIGNQVRMPALKSRSTFNPKRMTPPLPTNTTQNQTIQTRSCLATFG